MKSKILGRIGRGLAIGICFTAYMFFMGNLLVSLLEASVYNH